MRPILFHSFFGPLYSYPVFLAISFYAFYFYYFSFSKLNLDLTSKLKFILINFFFIYIFSKILFLIVLPIELSYMKEYITIFYGGGHVFFGGLIGGLISIFLLKRLKVIKFFEWNFLVPATLLAHGIGRIGCFLTGCCHGVKLYGVDFPIQIIESVILFFLFYIFHKNKNTKLPKSLFLPMYLLTYSCFRMVLERFRGDHIRGVYYNLSTSQWISIIFIISTLLYFQFKKEEV